MNGAVSRHRHYPFLEHRTMAEVAEYERLESQPYG